MTKLRQGVIKPVSLRSTSRSKASAMALGIGAFALIADPSGNCLGLFQPL